MDLKYKYVVIGYPYDYYWYCYHQLNALENSCFERSITFSGIINRLYGYDITYLNKFRLSKKIWINIFLDKLNTIIKKKKWESQDNICVVFLAGGLNLELSQYGLQKKIKKQYPNSRIVYYISDVSEVTRSYIPSMMVNSDLVITFDPSDSRKYNLLYHPIPYSKINFSKVPIEYDLSFVGIAKERLNSLVSLCNYLRPRGVKCKFVIVKVPYEHQVACEGIEYREWVSYEDNIRILLGSRCVLDFTQNSKCEGNTLRIGEAIMLDKKLLTNNPFIIDNGIYDNKFMRVFSCNEDIDINFIKSNIPVEYNIKNKMYPEELLCLIDRSIK